MLLDSGSFDKLIEAVNIDKSNSDDRTILVFVANSDVDSVCSVKQLQVRRPHATTMPASCRTLRSPMPLHCLRPPRRKSSPTMSPTSHKSPSRATRRSGRNARASGTRRCAGLSAPVHLTNLTPICLMIGDMLPTNHITDLPSCFSCTQELRTIFLVNCGATEDVRKLCDLEDNLNIRIIVIDSHRPIWHGHKNEADHTLVFLDADDPVPDRDIPLFQEHDMDLKISEC